MYETSPHTWVESDLREKKYLLPAVKLPTSAMGFGLGPTFPYFCLRTVFKIRNLLVQKTGSMACFMLSQSMSVITM